MQRKTILTSSSLALLGLALMFSQVTFAQSPQRDRVVAPIAGSPIVWLEGNVRPMFQPENDTGPVDGSLKLEYMSLAFKLTAVQQADLTALLAEQQDASSPNYRHWLTPEQYAGRFGLSVNDVSQVVAWLQAQGFQVIQTARGRNWVSFSGTAAQVQAAFHTEIHRFSVHGETYYANASEPAVPATLADVLLGIRGLDNYRLKPRIRVRHVTAETKPNFTSSLSGNTFVTPGDFAVIYDVNALYNNSIDGTGQSIAVMGQTDLYNNGSDVSAFRAASGLTGGGLTMTLIPGVTDPGVGSGDVEEASLDVEWSGAVAKNATIIYVYANPNTGNGVFDALQYAIDNDVAPVISISYGACEADWGSSNLSVLAGWGQQANSQGQTIVAAAGDSGATDCDSSETSVITVATQGLAVDAPASLPYVTGMGGSEFNEGSGNYWQATTSASGDIVTSALSYIPEMAWNDTSSPENTGNGLLAGGGGVSSYFTTKPAWQTGPGVPNDGARDVPDLSLNASPIHDPLLLCVQGSCVNGFRDSSQGLSVVGGTSAAAPTFAGIVALINEQMNTPKGQGNINTMLYPMAQTSPAAFHDITTGNNMEPCQTGSTGCPSGGEIGYSAGVGYDQATGLGSVDAYNLVMEWGSSGAGNLPAPTLAAPANGATGVALVPAFSWSAVTGNNGYRIFIATSASDLTANPATTTCSACTVVDTTAKNSSSYTPTSALAAGAYFWQVQALEPSSSSGTAAWSQVFSFTTTGGTLTAPTLTAPTTGATLTSVTPTFTWTAVTGSAGNRILIAPLQSALPTSLAIGTCGGCTAGTTTTAATYTPASTALAGGTAYYWEVQALAASGSSLNGPWSSVSNFITPAGDFSLSASPSSLTIAPGGSATSTVTLTAINNFSGTVTPTCAVSSSLAGVTCAISTSGTSNSLTVTVTASTTATTYPVLPRGPRFGAWWMVSVALLGLLLIGLSRLRYGGVPIRNLRLVALGAVLAALFLASLSCGGGSSGGGGGSTSSPPESGTVTVTGTSPSATHSTPISVSVT